jgi:putative FmdB family regulatory protein
MPIYEYRCADCGKTFDSIQRFSDEPFVECGQSSVECPKEGHGKVERLLSAPSFHFKGSGFYITDYNKGSGGAKDAKSPAAASGDSGKSSESKTESKPAAATTTSSDSTAKTPAAPKKDS